MQESRILQPSASAQAIIQCYAHYGYLIPQANIQRRDLGLPHYTALHTSASQPTLRLATLLDLPHHILLQSLGLRNASPPLHDLPVSADEKLLEVPLNAFQAQKPRLFTLHPLKHRLRFITVHVRLSQHGETDAVVQLAELLDLIIAAGVLRVELVAWEAEDDELVWIFGLHVFVQGFEAFELRCEAALGGGVYCEDDLAMR